jgi:hypothetical protein
MREGVSACCGYEVVEICEETVSGRVSADEEQDYSELRNWHGWE